MKKPILLTDLDDTLFPFAKTWAEWQEKTLGMPIDEAMYWYYDVDAYLHNFLNLQEAFIGNLDKLDPKPVKEAHNKLELLSDDFQIIALTARNSDEWDTHTQEWVSKHAPFIQNVIYARRNKGDAATPKSKIAEKLKAVALIDDSKHWVQSLPAHIKGYLVERPKPFPSDAGAVSWDFIYNDLKQS
jgi:hypothetical protein